LTCAARFVRSSERACHLNGMLSFAAAGFFRERHRTSVLLLCTYSSIIPPPVPARRGKCMSRRKGQNPKVRVGKRADRTKYYFFQYWIDVPGKEERKRMTVVLGPTSELTRSEAERKKQEFISKLQLNSGEYRIPSPATFADAVRYYREDFAPRMLRASTFSIADGHIRNHLEAYWNDVPIDHIGIDRVNQWAWKNVTSCNLG